MTTKKKLIEVALPLEAINLGSKPETENPFLRGHPRAIHNWWARTPLSVARALLFAQLIDDPGNSLPPEAARVEREKLLAFVAKLATWEATTDDSLIGEARARIAAQFNGNVPEFWDMFGGRASIPLEAQRLGMQVTSSDLNPVAVTIQRALLEFPARFTGRAPVHPQDRTKLPGRPTWKGTEGLAEDVRWFGSQICLRAKERLASLYPKGPNGKTVIAWLWARTVPSPDPACKGVHVPLVRSFKLAGQKRQVSVLPITDRHNSTFKFTIVEDKSHEPDGTMSRKGGVCLLSDAPMPFAYIREQAKLGNMHSRLMAIVTEGNRAREYHAPNDAHVRAAEQAKPDWRPDCEMPKKHRNFQPPVYGMDNIGDLFTPRQLVALGTICDLIAETRKELVGQRLDEEYVNALTFYLACAVSRMTDYHTNLATWNPTNENVSHLFQRQAIPMAWDFCEANPIEGKLSYDVAAEWVASSLESLPRNAPVARVLPLDARTGVPEFATPPVISTDPPYYDNISYADLADYFYVWLRRVLRDVDARTFATVLTPKTPELIASPTRHGSKELADQHFRLGFHKVFETIRSKSHPDVPCTIYYAFKQEEDYDASDEEGQRVSTGWETMLEGLVETGFQVTGTWPVRTTKKARAVARDANALASAIVLVCRPRPVNAPTATRRDLVNALKAELPLALTDLQRGNIAPADLAQAAIGPGMAVYTRFNKVLDAEGKPVLVREALALINKTLGETLTEQEGDFDADSRWALAWFEQYGFAEGEYGVAETLSKAKNTSVNGLVQAGILKSSRGSVRLLKPGELPADWDPDTDMRLTAWEMVHQLVRSLESGGESDAAVLAGKLAARAEVARELCYRLYSLCERKKRTAEALSYNSLVQSWPEIARLAREGGKPRAKQAEMFTQTED